MVRGGPSRPGRRPRPGLPLLLVLRPPRRGKWEVAAACVCAREGGGREETPVPPPRQRHCERRAPRGRVRIGRRHCCGAANKEEEPRREVGREDRRGQSPAGAKAQVGASPSPLGAGQVLRPPASGPCGPGAGTCGSGARGLPALSRQEGAPSRGLRAQPCQPRCPRTASPWGRPPPRCGLRAGSRCHFRGLTFAT